MSRVLQITDQQVFLGMEDGTIRDVPLSVFNYTPAVGDEVMIYQTGERMIIAKAAQWGAETASRAVPQSGTSYQTPVQTAYQTPAEPRYRFQAEPQVRTQAQPQVRYQAPLQDQTQYQYRVEPQTQTQAQPQVQPQIVINNVNTNTVTTAAAAGMRERNKWTAFFLCFFFGFLGAHCFYDGKAGKGILYLLTGGIVGIGVLVDLINILFRPNPYYVHY